MIRHAFSAKGRSFTVTCYGKSKTAITIPSRLEEYELVDCYQEELGRLVRENAALRKALASRAAICQDSTSLGSACDAAQALTKTASREEGNDRG